MLVFLLCENTQDNKRWDGCTALGTADTSPSSQHCSAYGAYLLVSPLAGCSAALETQYWSDPCVTGSQCSIAIELARKKQGENNLKQQLATRSSPHPDEVLRGKNAAGFSPSRRYFHGVCMSIIKSSTLLQWPSWLFPVGSQRDNLFCSSKILFGQTETCSDMSEWAEQLRVGGKKSLIWVFDICSQITMVTTLQFFLFRCWEYISDILVCEPQVKQSRCCLLASPFVIFAFMLVWVEAPGYGN